MTTAEIFSELKKEFGNHTKAANFLKIHPTHYRRLRNGRAHITEKMKMYLFFMLKQAHASANMDR